ncbi:THO complex subunit 7 homolog [Anoplophora glabripennis]|uniref:THO complex subunit 7 homolog n=1 Tax=Anoplophora glabripennis TaxID=217634 RepID=UPI000874A27F|nr:THO complex subunit 7 homolog [Anoplophora glabripennis]
MTDEQIIKRKLLFDGEGTGDDRRINFFQKMIAKWILTDSSSQEENENMYNKILLQLCLIEHSRQKSDLVKLRNDRQLQQYKGYHVEIEDNIVNIREAINTSKIVLAMVKCEKHQKLNYEMIVKDIVEQPPRIETALSVQQLQLNINTIKESQQKLKNEFIIWRKHFLVLLTSANQMFLRLNEFKLIDDNYTL